MVVAFFGREAFLSPWFSHLGCLLGILSPIDCCASFPPFINPRPPICEFGTRPTLLWAQTPTRTICHLR